jgi:transcriptional regulator with XRE-family HTH domain
VSRVIKLAVGATIRDLRVRACYSQELLAEKAGLHRTYVGGVERGERNVSLENIVRIARALRVKPSQLLEGVK